MAFDDGTTDGQAYSHALGFGRVEGFEKPLRTLSIEPDSGIPHE
ncbi:MULTISPECIES: hypothetical protein [unclassified Mesorhizobium]|nr:MULTISPECIES: hypothetical protein [unclassified Mesorhizobium]